MVVAIYDFNSVIIYNSAIIIIFTTPAIRILILLLQSQIIFDLITLDPSL